MFGNFLGGGDKLVKAKLLVFRGGKPAEMDVQFNPSEYTISRGVTVDDKTAAGKQSSPEDQQVTSGKASTLNLTLYFDSYTNLNNFSLNGIAEKAQSAIGGLMGGGNDATEEEEKEKEKNPEPDPRVTDLTEKMALLSRFASNLNEPPDVLFIWGSGLKFKGIVTQSSVQYTMFAPDGTPVRIKITMQIQGEELELLQQEASKTKELSDKTKEKLLPNGDKLWMVADEEYGDPGAWKTIAKANDILNPRSIDRAVSLKVPSIQ